MSTLENKDEIVISSDDDDDDDDIYVSLSDSDEMSSSYDSYSNEAAGVSYDMKLVSKITEMFPDASPEYVKKLCVGETSTTAGVYKILQIILSNSDYPKRKPISSNPDPDLDLEKQVELLKQVIPDADPNFLQYHAHLYINDKKKLAEFVSSSLELKNYPTMKEFIRTQQLSAQVKQYTTDFNIGNFLEIIPDPESYFSDPKKKSSISVNGEVDVISLRYATEYLKNRYPVIPVRNIKNTLENHNHQLIPTLKNLDKFLTFKRKLLKNERRPFPLTNYAIQNIPLLQEIAYLSHRIEIKRYLEEKAAKEKKEMELAKANGLLHTCNCCYNEEVMTKNIVNCKNGCDFCNECVKTSAEILFGEGKLDFPCLQNCTGFFSLQTLKDVLSPKLFSKVAQKKQLVEVKAAGIEELEMCPFCDFATIPAPGDKLFRCLNPECMKESCRQCKEPSHVPLRCDEVEKDNDVKRRTYIENKMTEALIRICYKCGMKFIKAGGCNKMTCSCGALMCYVCGKPVQDYKHFNGEGGDKYHLCPLYSDTNKLHMDAVVKGAEKAKTEIGVAGDTTKLKIDPTIDLHLHYRTKKSRKNSDEIVRNYDRIIFNQVVPLQQEGAAFQHFRNAYAHQEIHHHHHHHRHHHHHH